LRYTYSLCRFTSWSKIPAGSIFIWLFSRSLNNIIFFVKVRLYVPQFWIFFPLKSMYSLLVLYLVFTTKLGLPYTVYFRVKYLIIPSCCKKMVGQSVVAAKMKYMYKLLSNVDYQTRGLHSSSQMFLSVCNWQT
jgi:hypothetical protein